MTLRPIVTSISLGLTMVVLFAVCALAEVFGPTAQLSHAWINLFTRAPMGTGREWIEGTLSSLVFGSVAGLSFVIIYNALVSRD